MCGLKSRSSTNAALESLDTYLGIQSVGRPAVGDFRWVRPSTPLSEVNLNWRERDLPEKVRTKHVHRLHPYLGKFIPQLVEIFLRKFEPDTVLDPFCGSGTTLVESNALGIASIGVDVSAFNCLLTKVKTDTYDIRKLESEVKDILLRTRNELHHPQDRLDVDEESTIFLRTWFAPKALKQLLVYRSFIAQYKYSDVLKIIMSRSARSARLTTHFDLDFPKKPQKTPYYCHKHSRTCRPTNDASNFLNRYSLDTVERIREFSRIRTDAPVTILNEDSRRVDYPKFDAIVTSPPYVGLIDYHEQHRYAYELLGLPDKKDFEIGAASKGNSKAAKEEYASGIGEVFAQARHAIEDKGIVVIVVHDKHSLYTEMAARAGYEQEEVLTRNVNRRTGRRGEDFFEQILIWRPA